MARWRPDGWVNPFGDYKDPSNIHSVHALEWEAGADAMLEVLRKQGMPLNTERKPDPGMFKYPGVITDNGVLAFIPDDSE